MKYKRFCKRCGEIFNTNKKYARFCEECCLPSGNVKMKVAKRVKKPKNAE
jgi:uncharacterized C2H2 Zn-finger protein|tara:strand:+ start:350 stop:499 length:150 start_codon:yes stop_codon:yes gene_type:complete